MLGRRIFSLIALSASIILLFSAGASFADIKVGMGEFFPVLLPGGAWTPKPAWKWPLKKLTLQVESTAKNCPSGKR